MAVTLRRAIVAGALTLGGLGLAASPALATSAHIDTGFSSPSQLHVFDNDDNADVVTVNLLGANLIVTDTGPGGIAPDDASCSAVNATTVSCPLDPPDDPPPADPTQPIGVVSFQGNGGPDSLTVNPLLLIAADGGDGADVINGGPLDDGLTGGDGIDQLNGFGDDDSLDGGGDGDTLSGGEGDDFLDDGSATFDTGGTDVLDGGPGMDRADYFREDAVQVSLDDVANDGFAGEGDNLIDLEGVNTGDGADTVIGNDEANDIFSGDGNDVVRTLAGSDIVGGGDGDDTLDAGADLDQIFCDSGIDTAVLTPGDQVGIDCERTGASVDFDTATVDRKGVAKIPVACGALEAAACEGKLVLDLNGKTIGKGKFKVQPGKTKKAKVKLSKKGRKTLKRSGGSALVDAQAQTNLGGAKSIIEDSLLLKQKSGKGKGKGKK